MSNKEVNLLKSYAYVISDIHGQYKAFMEMLKKIKFKGSDMLYVIGDVIDRGSQSIKTLSYIMKEKNIVLLAGNHEYMAAQCLGTLVQDISDDIEELFLDGMVMGSLRQWYRNGGWTTLNELHKCDKEKRNEILKYLMHLKLYKELEIGDKKFLLVHGGLRNFEKNKKMKEYSITDLVWERMDYNKKYYDDKYIITGHTPTQLIEDNDNPGYIYTNGMNIDIDCGAAFGERLGCLRLNDMKEFYVDINGKKSKKVSS